MKQLLLSLILILSLSQVKAQNDVEYHLGFNLMPNHTGDLISFAIVKVQNEKVVGTIPCTRQKWIQYAGGIEMNPANKKLKNLFAEYEVDSCWILYDADYLKYDKKVFRGCDCLAMENLWKLRYKAHPYEHGPEGWGGKYNATDKQYAFLKMFFNVGSQIDYFYGENAFKLLKEMAHPEFAEFYAAGDLTWKGVRKEIYGESSDDTDSSTDESDESDEESDDSDDQ